MKTLADLKRTIKVGTRLRCIENTLRPELNDTLRTVVKVQGNAFVWHQDGQMDQRGSWTNFPKAGDCKFDGNTFQLSLKSAGHYVKMEVIG
jgi:hypothetical protein